MRPLRFDTPKTLKDVPKVKEIYVSRIVIDIPGAGADPTERPMLRYSYEALTTDDKLLDRLGAAERLPAALQASFDAIVAQAYSKASDAGLPTGGVRA